MVALFVRPDDHFQGMAGLHVFIVQRADHLDGSHAADVSVEVPPLHHRVDVRTEEQFRQSFGACAQTENVSGRVDAYLETGFRHQAGDVLPRGHVGLRKTEARDTALGIAAELTQSLERALQTSRIDVNLLGAGSLGW